MSGRLSTFAAAMVVARRDFGAILFSRSFIFFLIGPLFPLLVGTMASGVGQQVEANAGRATLALAMSPADAAAIRSSAHRLEPQLNGMVPELIVVPPMAGGRLPAPAHVLAHSDGAIGAVLSGTPAHPVLTGPEGLIEAWQGPVGLIAADTLRAAPTGFPPVTLTATKAAPVGDRIGRLRTAQAGQTLLFLLTMLLAGMVLSNLVEEKANKIIEILAAAIPMDAVFLGKLFAMLAVSFVGIAVWGATIGSVLLIGGHSLADFSAPAVGWPTFIALGVLYFAMAYLLLGSVFLTIGSMAATVREVQTLSMPVTMLQLLVFFFSSYTMSTPGSALEQAAVIIPFSSPFAMLARAAQSPDLAQHLAALGWQAVWVILFVRFGAQLFRRRVMKSGPATRRSKRANPQPQPA